MEREREGERKRKRGRGREKEKERERESDQKKYSIFTLIHPHIKSSNYSPLHIHIDQFIYPHPPTPTCCRLHRSFRWEERQDQMKHIQRAVGIGGVCVKYKASQLFHGEVHFCEELRVCVCVCMCVCVCVCVCERERE